MNQIFSVFEYLGVLQLVSTSYYFSIYPKIIKNPKIDIYLYIFICLSIRYILYTGIHICHMYLYTHSYTHKLFFPFWPDL